MAGADLAASIPPRSDRMRWRRGLVAATAATLIRGRWWVLALAAFLVRGGILLALPPLIVLPTPAELASLVSPNVYVAGLTDPAPTLLALAAATSIGLFVVILGTTIVGTWLDVALIEAGLADSELAPLASGRAAPSHRIALDAAIQCRLVAHIPTALALAVGVFALRDAAMTELTSPEGTGPLLLRILGRAPLATTAIVVAWFVGETWGGLAVRRLARETSVRSALAGALLQLVRPGAVATALISTLVVAGPLITLWLSAGRAFDRLWPILVEGGDLSIVLIGLGLLVASWAAGLWLLAIGLAFRSTAWTAEALREASSG